MGGFARVSPDERAARLLAPQPIVVDNHLRGVLARRSPLYPRVAGRSFSRAIAVTIVGQSIGGIASRVQRDRRLLRAR
jgi:hypothetical protein